MRRFALSVLCVCWTVALSAGEIETVSIAEGRQPRLAQGEQGETYCVFGVGEDVFCARSSDGGATFSAPAKVANVPSLMLGKRRGPRVTVANGSVVITAISSSDGNIVAWRSTDRGQSWSDAVRVNDVDRSGREGLHDMAGDQNGTIGAVWLDLRKRGTQLWSSFSSDGGATWGKNRLVYRSPDGNICECCHPTIASHDGHWYVLWRNSVDGNRDLYVSQLTNQDGSFTKAIRLGDRNWTLAACPMDGGDVAAGPAGTWATWRRKAICYATDLSAPSRELQLGDGEQPTVAVTAAGPTFAWINARAGGLMLQSRGDRAPRRIAEQANDPELLALADGTVLIAYERIVDKKVNVCVSRVAAEK